MMTDAESVAGLAKAVGDRLDVLVNNAGVLVDEGVPVTEVTTEQVRRTFDVNVFGVVTVITAMLPLLRRGTNAVIVNLSS